MKKDSKKRFNKQEFAKVLERACGDLRTQKEFAAAANISIPHMNKLLNAKFDVPPNLTTLRKIAAVAANGVTYADLLAAAGYGVDISAGAAGYSAGGLDGAFTVRESVGTYDAVVGIPSASSVSNIHSTLDTSATLTQAQLYESAIANAFISDINRLGLEWSMASDAAPGKSNSKSKSKRAGTAGFTPNFHLAVSDQDYSDWYIFAEYLPKSVAGSGKPSSEDLSYEKAAFDHGAIEFFGKNALFTGDISRAKFSVVTNNESYFDYLASRTFNSHIQASAILIDLSQSKIVKEKKLKTK